MGWRLLPCALALVVASRPAVAQPAPAGAAGAPPPVDSAARLADARFMQAMLHHHAQAVAMSALVPSRTRTPALRLLAERIEVSQQDEMALMRDWLARRGIAEAPPPTEAAGPTHRAHGDAHAPGAATMPGMLTTAELEQLAAARDAEFDRRFLAGMIKHHEGALAMVRALAAVPGAGQDPALARFAADVRADQAAEIRRMRALLQALPPAP